MFPWIHPTGSIGSRPFNLEAEFNRCQKERIPCILEGKAFYAQFAGAPGVDEARDLAFHGRNNEAAEAFLDHYLDRIRPLFFVHNSETHSIRPALLRDKPYCKAIIEAAREVLAHRFKPFGFKEVEFPQVIDWFTDFDEHSWPRMHVLDLAGAFRMTPPVISEDLSPIELTWELNKHEHFLTLAQAYGLTGDENLGAEFIIQAVDWATSNPPSMGVNWLNEEVVATRTVNWLLAINLFLSSSQFTPSLFVKLWSTVVLHGAYLNWQLRNTTKPCVAVASALYLLAMCIPELRLAQHWLNVAAKALEIALPNEFGSNGFHLSGSMAKHRQQTEWLLLPSMLHYMNNSMPLATLESFCASAIDALRALYSPGEASPELGERVSSSFFGRHCGAAEHTRRLLCLGAMSMRQGHWRSAISALPSEMYWWFGPGTEQLFTSLEPRLPMQGFSSLYQEVGIGVVRDTWDVAATQCIMRAAPINDFRSRLFHPIRPNQPSFSAQFHDDSLGLVLACEDEPFLIEPGLPLTPGYPHTQLGRLSAHSSPRLPGELEPLPTQYSTPWDETPDNAKETPPPQPQKPEALATPQDATFRTENQPAAKPPLVFCSPLHMETRGANTLMWAKREAWLSPEVPASILRTLLFLPAEQLLIVRDTVDASNNVVPYEFNMLLSPHLYIMMRGDMGCSVRGKKLHARIMPVFPPRSRHSLCKGSTKPFLGWHVNEQDQITAATNLKYFTNLATPTNVYVIFTWNRQGFSTPKPEQMDAWIDGSSVPKLY